MKYRSVQKTTTYTLLTVLLALPLAVSAQLGLPSVLPPAEPDEPESFRDLVADILLPLLDQVVSVVTLFIVLFFIWNGVRLIRAADNAEARSNAKSLLFWSVIVLFVVFGLWSIVNIIALTLGLR